jgi:hypothetical protein
LVRCLRLFFAHARAPKALALVFSKPLSLGLGVGSLVFSAFAGCSLSVNADAAQCQSNADCTARGSAFADSVCLENICTYECKKTSECTQRGDEFWNTECRNHACAPSKDWGCVVADAEVVPVASRPATSFALTLPVTDMLTGAPVPGVTARVCHLRDLDCNAPLGADIISDKDGLLALTLAGNFDGYVQIQGKERVTGLYFPPPLTRDRADTAVALAKAVDLLPFGQLVGGFEADRGTVMVQVVDCAGIPAEGVSFESNDADSRASAWYSENSLPVGTKATDVTGFGGYFNMPSGIASIRATVAGGEHVVGTVGLVIRPGALSYGRFVPTGS